jgi:CubicO group peptidase (beta-lactamase class C family)
MDGARRVNLTELLALAPMPAVAVSVFDRDRVVFTGTRGAPEHAWWDLASVTKILVTLPEALERLELDKPLGQQWSRAADRPVGAATVRQLLAHNAGLPAIVPFFQTARSREEIVEGALCLALEREPGGDAVYSDFGFLLLGELIQELTGRSLPDLAAERTGLRFGPIAGDAVPTERCPWRGRLIVGEVHDENAYAMGGVAGHAGAFGTLDLVTRAARAWFAAGDTEVSRCQATNPQGERFGLGWWLANTRGLGGPTPGPSAYGCSGFVGNRIWLEPDYGYGVVILSNRVHPVRGDRAPFAAWCAGLLQAAGAALRTRLPTK